MLTCSKCSSACLAIWLWIFNIYMKWMTMILFFYHMSYTFIITCCESIYRLLKILPSWEMLPKSSHISSFLCYSVSISLLLSFCISLFFFYLSLTHTQRWCVCFAVRQTAGFSEWPPCMISAIDRGCVSFKADGGTQEDSLCLCGQPTDKLLSRHKTYMLE